MADGRNGYPDRFVEQIALGLVPGFTTFRKFGMNDAVNGSSVTEDVWPIGTVRTLPTSAAVCACVSDDANDNGVTPSTGALTMRIEGLDANYLEIAETVTLNGLTTVNTTASFLRVNRAYILTAGTSETNEGGITITVGGNAQAYIEADEGQTHQCMYTVPANKTLLITQYRIKAGRMAGSTDCQVEGQIKTVGGAWRTISDIYLFGPDSWTNDHGATLIPPKTELRMQATSSGATEVSGIFAGYLVENDILDGM